VLLFWILGRPLRREIRSAASALECALCICSQVVQRQTSQNAKAARSGITVHTTHREPHPCDAAFRHAATTKPHTRDDTTSLARPSVRPTTSNPSHIRFRGATDFGLFFFGCHRPIVRRPSSVVFQQRSLATLCCLTSAK